MYSLTFDQHKAEDLTQDVFVKAYCIADYITANYCTYGEKPFDNVDSYISYVQKNGVRYVGALITGDTKELLNLKNNSNIYSCRVEDIVVW